MATDHNFKVKNGLTVEGGEIYLQGVATPQIFFNGNADVDIDMAIKATPESLDFYEPEDANKLHMRIVDDLGVNGVFGLRTGAGDGTLRLDGSGNLQNIGTISSGAITSNASMTLSGTGTELLFSGGNNRIKFSGYRALEGNTTGTNLQLAEGYGSTTVQSHLNMQSGYEIRYAGTTVIDSSLNLTNIGTISSGAITANGGSTQSVIKSSSDAPLIVESTDAYSGINFKDTGGNSSMFYLGSADHLYLHSAKFSVAGSTLASGYQFQVNGSANLTGSLAIGGLQVIAATTRNLTNIGTISSGAITSTGTITAAGLNSTGDLAFSSTTTTTPAIKFNTSSGTDTTFDMAIRGNGEGLDFYEPEDVDKVHMRIVDDTGVNAVFGFRTGTGDGTLRIDGSGNATLGTISSGAITSTSTISSGGSVTIPYASEIRSADSGGTVRTMLRISSDIYQLGWSGAGDVQFMGGGSYTERMAISGTTGDVSIVNNLSVAGAVSSGVLTVNGGTPNIVANFISTDSIAGIKLQDNNGNVELSAAGTSFRVQPSGNAPVFEIASSGAITSTVVNTGDATFLTLHHDTGGDLDTQQSFIDFSFEDDNTNETPQVRIGAQVGQNNNADSQEKEGSGAFVIHTNNAESVSGAAGTSLAERMRVDYQGNVLIGKTASDFATAGAELAKDGTPGKVQFSRASNPLSLNNITNNGNIISFYKGAGAVGDIGIEGGDSLYIQAGTTSGSGLRFHPSAGTVEPVRNGVTIHNTINLGSATRQFKDAYFEKVYVRQNTTQTGAVLEFSDEPSSWSQNGSITFRHVDTQSYGSGAMFEIGSDQPTTTILAQGKLYFSEGLYTKPASGTGVGTLRISSSGNATLGTIAASTITATGTDTQQYRLLQGTAVAGGIFKERTITGAGVSNDVCIFAESITDGGNIHFMTGGSATIRATIASDGDAAFGGSLSVSGAITTSSGMDITAGAVSGAVMGANRSLGINATEAQIHLVAHNTGDWASNIVLTNHSDSATRHYWIHNAPATASYNANKFELRTSTTTTAAQIGGQGTGSSAILVIDSSGNTTTKGSISIDAADGFVYLNNDGVGNAGIYVRGIGSTDTLRSHSTDNFRWEVLGSQKMELTNSGHLTVTGNLNGAIITGSTLNVEGLVKFGDVAGSPAADIHVYGTGNNYLRLRGTSANDYEIDLQGTGSTGQLVFNQFDLKTNNNIIIDGSSKYLIIENHAETDTGIIFNDGDASNGGNWDGSSSQAFKIQYHCGNETLIMGHDNDSYAGFNFAIGGNFTASGNVTAYSDERLKENIETLDGSKVLQMRGVSFTKEGKQGSGVIAQELEKVAPELVIDGEYKSVAYGNLVGYLIENAKQQQERIEKLEELVYRLMSEK